MERMLPCLWSGGLLVINVCFGYASWGRFGGNAVKDNRRKQIPSILAIKENTHWVLIYLWLFMRIQVIIEVINPNAYRAGRECTWVKWTQENSRSTRIKKKWHLASMSGTLGCGIEWDPLDHTCLIWRTYPCLSSGLSSLCGKAGPGASDLLVFPEKWKSLFLCELSSFINIGNNSLKCKYM